MHTSHSHHRRADTAGPTPCGTASAVLVRTLLLLMGVGSTLSAQSDTSSARRALQAFDEACGLPSARVWGASLCGPMVLVDRQTRAAMTNRPDPDGQFARRGAVLTGVAPSTVPLANTSFTWAGTRWAVVMLPVPSDDWSALALLAHEATHRLFDSLGHAGRDVANTHLDQESARVWWRLELRALQHALTTTGVAQRGHIEAALRFRSYRARLYPGSSAAEDALEMAEGLAEYTGHQVALSVYPMGRLMTVNHMRSIESTPSLVRGAAYATGPALGLLLDDRSPGWHSRIWQTTSMATLLSQAVKLDTTAALSVDALQALATPYGFRRIAREERDRAAAQRARRERSMATLVDGPTLTLRHEALMRSFDPTSLFPLDSLGTVYPTGTFEAAWGKLTVTDGGALLSADGTVLRVRAPADAAARTKDATAGTSIEGPGWTLVLANGWRLGPGARPGDVVVTQTP